ncbi:hypothetical protein DL770_002060 [Monosporascus sp. CRB-9-2]|nr:hypothetical protein DL770_002060 [Monosporascus sp. CRB-9-2]
MPSLSFKYAGWQGLPPLVFVSGMINLQVTKSHHTLPSGTTRQVLHGAGDNGVPTGVRVQMPWRRGRAAQNCPGTGGSLTAINRYMGLGLGRPGHEGDGNDMGHPRHHRLPRPPPTSPRTDLTVSLDGSNGGSTTVFACACPPRRRFYSSPRNGVVWRGPSPAGHGLPQEPGDPRDPGRPSELSPLTALEQLPNTNDETTCEAGVSRRSCPRSGTPRGLT